MVPLTVNCVLVFIVNAEVDLIVRLLAVLLPSSVHVPTTAAGLVAVLNLPMDTFFVGSVGGWFSLGFPIALVVFHVATVLSQFPFPVKAWL